MLLSQLLHHYPVLNIKIRTVPSLAMLESDDEEVVLLFSDKVAVCIDGPSLWMAIRIGYSQTKYGEQFF